MNIEHIQACVWISCLAERVTEPVVELGCQPSHISPWHSVNFRPRGGRRHQPQHAFVNTTADMKNEDDDTMPYRVSLSSVQTGDTIGAGLALQHKHTGWLGEAVRTGR